MRAFGTTSGTHGPSYTTRASIKASKGLASSSTTRDARKVTVLDDDKDFNGDEDYEELKLLKRHREAII